MIFSVSFLQKYVKWCHKIITGVIEFSGFAVNGINNVKISSYERRYHLDSKQSSLVASMHDIGAAVAVSYPYRSRCAVY